MSSTLLVSAGPLTPWGKWDSALQAEFLDTDPQTIRLTRPLRWQDKYGSVEAPAEFVSDGATIPRAVWSLVGGPFDGLYAAPAMIHDYGLRQTNANVWAVHYRFYLGMRAKGVGFAPASLFYAAVVVNQLFK